MTAEEVARAEIAARSRNDVDEVMNQFAQITDGKQMSWPVMGAYQAQGEKIKAWREYFYPPTET